MKHAPSKNVWKHNKMPRVSVETDSVQTDRVQKDRVQTERVLTAMVQTDMEQTDKIQTERSWSWSGQGRVVLSRFMSVACILCPVSCVLHPVPYVLCLVSSARRPSHLVLLCPVPFPSRSRPVSCPACLRVPMVPLLQRLRQLSARRRGARWWCAPQVFSFLFVLLFPTRRCGVVRF